MIFHTDRVSTEVGYGPLNDCCVLFRGPRHTAAGSEFWKVRAGDRNRKSAIGLKDQRALWGWTEWLNFLLSALVDSNRDQGPRTYKLLGPSTKSAPSWQ